MKLRRTKRLEQPQRIQNWAVGPRVRPFGEATRCACGGHFVAYWVHRETGRHKRWARESRQRLREART